jgi:Na+/phosphate symporter
MSEFTERLRRIALHNRNARHEYDILDTSDELEEAADEIERLTAIVDTLRPEAGFGQVFDDYVETVAIVTEYWKAGSLRARVQALADDRERLQAALLAAEDRAASAVREMHLYRDYATRKELT